MRFLSPRLQKKEEDSRTFDSAWRFTLNAVSPPASKRVFAGYTRHRHDTSTYEMIQYNQAMQLALLHIRRFDPACCTVL